VYWRSWVIVPVAIILLAIYPAAALLALPALRIKLSSWESAASAALQPLVDNACAVRMQLLHEEGLHQMQGKIGRKICPSLGVEPEDGRVAPGDGSRVVVVAPAG